MRKTALACIAAAVSLCGALVVSAPAAIAAPATGDVSITISGVGDCTLGVDAYFNYSASLNAMYSAKGPAYFLSGVKSVLSKDDLTIANLEGTLTTRGSRANKTYAFRGRPVFTKILTKGSVEAVTFANNHAYDYGTVSHTDTIKYVKKAGIKIASYSRVSYYTTKGVKVAMVAVNDIGDYNAKTLIRKGCAKAKKAKADIIVVSIHAGIEREHYANDRQKSLAHYAVNKGANLVLGCHPHVLQGVEKYKGVYIAYSLGNFCFGGNSNPSEKTTMIFQRTFTFHNGKLVKDKACRVIPCWLSSHFSYNDYRPRFMSAKRKLAAIGRINKYSKSLGLSFNKKGWAKK